MSLRQHLRKAVIALSLVLVLLLGSACGEAPLQSDRSTSSPVSTSYQQLERGNTNSGQNFGDWVIQTAHGLVQDAYVRDNNKLGVVISPQVRLDEVRPLAKSLVQGFHQNFPDRNLTVLVYAPDKQLILKADYNSATQQIEYSAA
ncbi:MAG: hypothetical protein HC890_09940 [Chloroflexaceae bacterium]|nr:hypothetical protein [Chloroflexaceae bacterium]